MQNTIEQEERKTMAEKCDGHDRFAERIADCESEISALDERTKDMTELFNRMRDQETKLSVIEQKQDTTNEYLKRMEKSLTRWTEECSNKFLEYDKRFKELEDFSWFRNWMTGIRNKLPEFVMRIILVVLFILILAHEINIRQYLAQAGRWLGIIK